MALAIACASAHGQTEGQYPTKPIRLITSAPGGTSDFTSRLIAQGLTENLGKQVIVDNRGDFGG
jgi:tripartite-type tricarboxylate transporter receptor subunit TctC